MRLLHEKEESERRLSKVANSIPGALIVYKRHLDGWDELLFGNEKIQEIFGVTREDAMTDARLLWRVIHPEDLDRVNESVDRSAQDLSFWNETWRVVTPQGNEKMINGRGQPHREDDGAVVWDSILLDLTDLHLAQQEVRSANFRMSVASDSAGFGFWEVNLRDSKEIWDDRTFELFGVPKDTEHQNFFGVNVAQVSPRRDAWLRAVHLKDAHHAIELLERCIEKQTPYENTLRVILEDGSIRYLRAHANVMLNEAGEPERVIGVNYDVTDIVEAEQQLRNSEKNAREANEAKSQFLSVMNHELRTPLNAIIGPIEMLEQADLEPDEKELLGFVRPAAKHLLALINDILNLSKIEAGHYESNLEDIDPAEFCAIG